MSSLIAAKKLLMASAGGKSDPVYIDDVFSTDVYTGTGTMDGSSDSGAKTITNSIDYSEGALTWLKQRSKNDSHQLYDTVRGDNKRIYSNSTAAENTANGDRWGLKFNSNGYTLGNAADGINVDGRTNVGWTFRKQKGFFDIVSYTGTGSAHSIAHSLGSVPGCIIIKNLGAGYNWKVYHTRLDPENPANYSLGLDQNIARGESTTTWNDTLPTATHFTVGTGGDVNTNGSNFIAYLFAGGKSTAATARSVDFDGDGDYLSFSDSDTAPGSGAFTIECWVKPDSTHTNNNNRRILRNGDNNATGSFSLIWNSSSQEVIVNYNATTLFGSHSFQKIARGQWTHIALVREGTGSNQTKLYLNGIKVREGTLTQDLTLHAWQIGTDSTLNATNFSFNGRISNVRLVVGTAVYTSSFRPPTAPLTNITNTKLLCCNNSSTTGKTVGPTITANGNVTASTDIPFDDPAGFKFGEEGDQNVIKCGSHVGNGSATGPEVYLGWEPQYVLVKRTGGNAVNSWVVQDSMRGIVTGYNNSSLWPDGDWQEVTNNDFISLTSTGFTITSNSSEINASGSEYITIAIRRPDGYVGKPVEAGTDSFAISLGQSSVPGFVSNFPVDFSFWRENGTQDMWRVSSRLTRGRALEFNDTSVETSRTDGFFDYNNGFLNASKSTSFVGWMLKRGQGFDVVTYKGNAVDNRNIPHSLGKAAEMVWVKNRESINGWQVFNKYLNSGADPHTYRLELNENVAEFAAGGNWGNGSPTSSYFIVGDGNGTNGDDTDYISYLFASVEGISKCGYYGGSNATSTITTGFAPRFLIVKRISGGTGDWFVWDTLRGWGAGNEPFLELNDTAAQTNFEAGAPTATGFTITNYAGWSEAGSNYIYYAHA